MQSRVLVEMSCMRKVLPCHSPSRLTCVELTVVQKCRYQGLIILLASLFPGRYGGHVY